jgi:hypothetical protein
MLMYIKLLLPNQLAEIVKLSTCFIEVAGLNLGMYCGG